MHPHFGPWTLCVSMDIPPNQVKTTTQKLDMSKKGEDSENKACSRLSKAGCYLGAKSAVNPGNHEGNARMHFLCHGISRALQKKSRAYTNAFTSYHNKIITCQYICV